MDVVNQFGAEKLLDGGDASADANAFSVCSGCGLLHGGLNSFSDEMECCATCHGDGGARVVRQHEDWRVEGRIFRPAIAQYSSSHGPRTGPNMLRPMIDAPTFSKLRAAKSSSMPVVPVVLYRCRRWKVRVGTSHAVQTRAADAAAGSQGIAMGRRRSRRREC